MNTKNILFVFVFPFTIVYLCPEVYASSSIRINEIAWMGTDGSQYGEWIELHNNSSDAISLKDWKISKRKNGNDVVITSLTKEIDGYGYYLIERTTKSMKDPIPNIEDDAGAWGGSGLSNSGEFLLLKDKDDVIIDSVDGSDNWKINGSSETIGSNDAPKKTAQLIGTFWKTLPPTPKAENEDTKEIKKPTYNTTIRLNEILANPSEKEEDFEFIELFNTSDTLVDLSSWSLKDASAEGKYTFPENTIVQPKSFLVIYRPIFKFALNNSNETLSLLDPNDAVRDTISYNTANEDISYNYTATGWRGGIPTPNALNRTNTPPATKENISKKGYINVPIDFDARGEDTDQDALKYVWDFGDGHKSYKEHTSHTYEKEGKYILTLRTTDGKDDTLETFTITIESFPRRNIRIISLLPNPAGSDTLAEQIIIRNNEKKKINLKDYRIATGWKKLVNHTIREDVFIKPKGEVTITHTEASFTLPNQKAKIELRAPDGKTLQKIRYKLAEPITEDTWYTKEKGKQWEWKSVIKTSEKNMLPKEKTEAPIITLKPIEEKKEEKKRVSARPKEEEKQITSLRSDHIAFLRPHTSLSIITSYGTSVHIPTSITLSLVTEQDDALPADIDPTISQQNISLFRRINSFFNTLLNAF